MSDAPTITARLKVLRERAGLSIRAMAERAKMSSSGYAHYENPARFKDPFLPMAVALEFARALDGTGVERAEMLALAGSHAEPRPALTGFNDATTPYAFQEEPTNPEDPQRGLRAIYGTAATLPASYRLQSTYPAFALLQGDVVICDLARQPRPGELALVSVFDEDAATSITTLRRFLPPFLPSGSIAGEPVLRVDHPGVTVRYPVIGSIRGLPMTTNEESA